MLASNLICTVRLGQHKLDLSAAPRDRRKSSLIKEFCALVLWASVEQDAARLKAKMHCCTPGAYHYNATCELLSWRLQASHELLKISTCTAGQCKLHCL